MRKLFMVSIAIMLIFSMSTTALAASSNSEKSVQRVHIMEAANQNEEGEMNARAVSAPTSYAPTAWYIGFADCLW